MSSYKDRANIITDNSLDVNWAEFTDGTEDVVILANFPFERSEELMKSDMGRDTVSSWKRIQEECKVHEMTCSMRSTCDAAFFAKAQLEDYKDVTAIGYSKTRYNVDGIKVVEDSIDWSQIGGDANVTASVYQLCEGAKAMSNEMTGKRFIDLRGIKAKNGAKRSQCSKTPVDGWVPCRTTRGVVYADPKYAVKVSAGSVIVNQTKYKTVDIDTEYTLSGHLVFSASELVKRAINSHAMEIWVSAHSSAKTLGSKGKKVLTDNVAQSFPHVSNEDLDRYETMSDEDILAELDAKYLAEISE